jgi:uncharacterized membrane protein YdjX (TVP38/TMEM64 family)
LKKINIQKIIFALVLITLVVLAFLNKDKIDLVLIKEQILALGLWAPVLFAFIYILAAIAFLPSFPFSMLAGLIFGFTWGGLYAVLAATLGAMLSFLIARYIAGDWLEGSNSEMITKLRTGSEKHGWKFLAITRLTMVFPYNLQNYGFGLTKMPFWLFTITTLWSMAPSVLVYVYLGSIGKNIAF